MAMAEAAGALEELAGAVGRYVRHAVGQRAVGDVRELAARRIGAE
jgi:hypothetical protein